MKLEQKLYKLSKGDKQRLIEKLRNIFKNSSEVAFAYLHGSMLREGPIRDIDVAVWLHRNTDPLNYVIEKGLEIEQLLGFPVDIQVLNVAPVTFRYVVYTRGIPVIVNDAYLHSLEVAKTILMYLDLKFLRKKCYETIVLH